ncbi:prepilin-type cleavage/methylation-like protein [Zobellella endophytica]|uniref:Prepilin-type cleavage/methylation-like protein n=1 Tax=Zobellella endophytica TaxID=2116700 RepID=A0A2P7RDE9_9GAMM|nr:prepilin-type N-terminal cleavage/methylation domain-containing protein [Zobellella endophytica]PSJ48202.1 prepilin-type cleavage/methylation-like protein [Zobellella endophytica]
MRPEPGFSLLEFVLGLVILAIALVGVTLFFAAQPRQLDPVFQFRAVSLAEALAEQILAVPYDAQNNPAMQRRCDITAGAGVCSAAAGYGTEHEADRGIITRFDDVDDFHDWCTSPVAGTRLAADLGLPDTALYSRFQVTSCVTPQTDEAGQPYKQIRLTVRQVGSGELSLLLNRYNIR